ncbi:aspartic proteinase cdr1 [Quercus suber]|uniref:Aspartic proteinase cdr1 n=1 Tax=Quercus suber TaxID=58331 RepID=A0AAW0MCN0_QUESU
MKLGAEVVIWNGGIYCGLTWPFPNIHLLVGYLFLVSFQPKLESCNGVFQVPVDASLIEASSGGFSVDLIHRDSPNSPFYNPSETPSQRIAKAVRRSISLVNRFKPTSSLSTNAAQSDISSNGGEYLLKYSVGTPPVEILGFADTSTDLIWLQCEPCSICYNQTAPIFYPKKSSTYKKASCSSAQCQSLPHSSSSGGNNSSCQYSMDYYDGSSSDGDLAVDTLTLGSTTSRPVPLPKTIIGCGYDNERFTNANGSGVIGLGRGAISLASQPGSSIGGKFSYCLIPFTSHGNTTSKLNFGSNAVVAGSGAVSTPLILGQDSYYYITLEAISVGRKRIDLTNASESGNLEKGNIIINSGITVTSLPEQLYPDDFRIPSITAHFTGADVELSSNTTFISVNEEVVCLAFVPADDLQPATFFGNLAQSNLLVGIDVLNETVSFKPTDCTKH